MLSAVGCGSCHTVVVDDDGNLRSFGSSKEGGLGLGKKWHVLLPQQIEIDYRIISVSCGSNFTICLTQENQLLSFGGNKWGQLGLGNTQNSKHPKLIIFPEITQIISIKCGDAHVICIDNTNSCWGFGKNKNGQLGDFDGYRKLTPQKIDLEHIISVGCGKNFSVFLNEFGELFSCGGKMSDGRIRLVLGFFTEYAILKPTKVEFEHKIISISCGYFFTFILDENGNVYHFGIFDDYLHQQQSICKITPTKFDDLPKIDKIICGYHHCYFIDKEKKLWGFGYNIYGQINPNCNYAVPLQQMEFVNVENVYTSNHTFVILNSGEIYILGQNKNGQLGNGSGITLKKPKLFPHDNIIKINLLPSTCKSARK